jgi:MFS family permease
VFVPLLMVGPLVAAAAFMLDDPIVALPGFALTSMIYQGFGATAAALQLAAPAHLRGRLTATSSVVTSGIGLGLGPVVVGFLTTYVFHSRGMLGRAMVLSLAGASALAVLFYVVGRPAYCRALAAEEATGDPPPTNAPTVPVPEPPPWVNPGR